jgi:hypothetical protein
MAAEKPPDDVAAILEALRAEVRSRREAMGSAETGTALSAIERELHHAVEQLEITRVVSAHWPLQGRTRYERAMVLVHKLVRRGLRWYINPIVEQQNGFNEAAARALRLLAEANSELREQVAELRRQLDQAPPSSPAPASTPPPDGALPESAELQQLVERAGRAEPPAALPDLEARPIVLQLAQRKEVSAHWPLGGATALGRARALVQRAVRQYLRWLINPIVEQQNGCNAAIAETSMQLAAVDGELRARVAALRAQQR